MHFSFDYMVEISILEYFKTEFALLYFRKETKIEVEYK